MDPQEQVRSAATKNGCCKKLHPDQSFQHKLDPLSLQRLSIQEGSNFVPAFAHMRTAHTNGAMSSRSIYRQSLKQTSPHKLYIIIIHLIIKLHNTHVRQMSRRVLRHCRRAGGQRHRSKHGWQRAASTSQAPPRQNWSRPDLCPTNPQKAKLHVTGNSRTASPSDSTSTAPVLHKRALFKEPYTCQSTSNNMGIPHQFMNDACPSNIRHSLYDSDSIAS